jgi:excisionase family DNA binding protein
MVVMSESYEVKDYMDGQSDFLREGRMEYETLLNAEQVAKMMGLSVATVRKWVLTRFIPYRKIGRSVRFSLPEILEWMKSRCIEPLDGRQKINANEIEGGANYR